MTEADVARIESELGVRLGAQYRAFVLEYPQSLREAQCGHHKEPASASFLFDDPELVIETNRRFCRPHQPLVGYGESPWPDDYLVVGMDQPWRDTGDAYCVRLVVQLRRRRKLRAVQPVALRLRAIRTGVGRDGPRGPDWPHRIRRCT